MTTNLLPLLNRLHQAAPEMCQRESGLLTIGEYQFFEHHDYQLVARVGNIGATHKGRPALAWLADALESAIEARGWDYDTTYDSTGSHWVSIEGHTGNGTSKAEALLTALVAAVEAERVR